MIKFQKANIFSLIFLIVYWSLVISITIFSAVLAIAVFFFLISNNPLYFDWMDECISAVKKGGSAGTVLGIGIWIKAKIEENNSKKSLNEAQK